MLIKTLLVCFVVLFSTVNIVSGQKVTRLNGSTILLDTLDKTIERLLHAADVQGLEISIFNNNRIVYKKAFGYTRSDTRLPLQTNSNMYGASFSKAVFAVLVMKLVEEGALDLDKPLQQYLSKPIYDYKPLTRWHDNYSDLKNDSLYKKITARMCLDHTTGFANWRWDEKDEKLRVILSPVKNTITQEREWFTCRLCSKKCLASPWKK